MGELVAALGVSHAPGQTAFPEIAPPDKWERIRAAWHELETRLNAASPDIIVAISNDHLQNFFRVQPAFCVGRADAHVLPTKSQAGWLRLESRAVPGHPAFAETLIGIAAARGVDLAFSEDLVFHDEFSVPWHFLAPDDRVGFVPILTNCLNRDPPSPRRFFELGRVIAAAIADRPPEERIAVIGTGGLSHDPMGPNWCLIDEAFDRRFLQLLVAGQTEVLFREYTLERIFEPGKGGTPEILNWFTALGAVGHGKKATMICYESVPELATGLGYLVWDTSA